MSKEKNLLATATGYLGLYSVYVFVAGRTFFDYYYEAFGVDPRWLDLSLADTMLRGFTLLFLWNGAGMWPIYIFVILSPLSFEIASWWKRRAIIQAGIIVLLISLIPTTYWVAARAGEKTARRNKGDSSVLPYVTFTTKTGKQGRFGGRLLLWHSGMIFVHRVSEIKQLKDSESINLHVYRVEDTADVEITEKPE